MTVAAGWASSYLLHTWPLPENNKNHGRVGNLPGMGTDQAIGLPRHSARRFMSRSFCSSGLIADGEQGASRTLRSCGKCCRDAPFTGFISSCASLEALTGDVKVPRPSACPSARERSPMRMCKSSGANPVSWEETFHMFLHLSVPVWLESAGSHRSAMVTSSDNKLTCNAPCRQMAP